MSRQVLIGAVLGFALATAGLSWRAHKTDARPRPVPYASATLAVPIGATVAPVSLDAGAGP